MELFNCKESNSSNSNFSAQKTSLSNNFDYHNSTSYSNYAMSIQTNPPKISIPQNPIQIVKPLESNLNQLKYSISSQTSYNSTSHSIRSTHNLSNYVEKWNDLIFLEQEPLKKEFIELKKSKISKLISKGRAILLNSTFKVKSDDGKYLITFQINSSIKFKLGEIINFYDYTQQFQSIGNSEVLFSGITDQVSNDSLTILTGEIPDDLTVNKNKRLLAVQFPNSIMFRKFEAILDEIPKIFRKADDNQALLIRLLLDLDTSIVPESQSLQLQPFYNTKLNTQQMQAVNEAVNTGLFYALQGPPGTGKSTVINEIIHQLISMEKKVLVCSNNNMSTDNLAIPLIQRHESRLLRIGNKSKVQESVFPILLSEKISKDPTMKKFNQDEDFYLQNQISDSQSLIDIRRDRQKYLKKLQAKFQKDALVIFSTINGSRSDILKDLRSNMKFDYVIIDECAQSPEIATWLPMLNGSKIIIAGDHYQLPCCVKNPEAAEQGYGISLMERIFEKLPNQMKRTLEIQYRMNRYLNEWPSNEFYKGRLVAGDPNKEKTLKELLKPRYADKKVPIMKLISTGKHGFTEKKSGTSYVNYYEAAYIIMEVLDLFTFYNLKQEKIGVITPYAAQSKLILEGLKKTGVDKVEVASVDSFQGREKEVIIMSMVRSNKNDSFGFTCDPKRLNVAVTRAKRALIVVCNAEMMKRSGIVKRLLKKFVEEKKNNQERLASTYRIVDGIKL